MKTIVVFGATGKVGAYTSVELAKNYKVIAVGKRESDNGFFRDYGIDYYSIDITKKTDFSKLPMEGIDAVVHAAGMMPAHMQGYEPHAYIDTEIRGTLNVLEYMVGAKAERIIYTCNSNNSMYKLGKIPVPPEIQKNAPLNNDHSIFAISKNAAVDIIEHFHIKYGIKRFVLRLYHMYVYHPSPYYHVDGEKKWITHRMLIERAKRGMDIEIWGQPSKAKEAVYIYDCISIIKGALEAPHEGGVYNTGGIAPVSIEDTIRAIVEVFSPSNLQSKIIYKPDMPNAPEFASDSTKTRRELGYTPQWNCTRFFRDIKEKMEANHFSKLWGVFRDYKDNMI